MSHAGYEHIFKVLDLEQQSLFGNTVTVPVFNGRLYHCHAIGNDVNNKRLCMIVVKDSADAVADHSALTDDVTTLQGLPEWATYNPDSEAVPDIAGWE